MILGASFVVSCALLVLAYGAATSGHAHAGVKDAAAAAVLLAAVVMLSALMPDAAAVRVMLEAVIASLMCNGARKMIGARTHLESEIRQSIAREPGPSVETIAQRAAEMARAGVEPSWRMPLWEAPGVLMVMVDRSGKVRRLDGGIGRRSFKKPHDAVGLPVENLGNFGREVRARLAVTMAAGPASWTSAHCAGRITPTYDTRGEVDGVLAVIMET